MKILIATLLYLGVSTHAFATEHGVPTAVKSVPDAAWLGGAGSMLQSVENAPVARAGEDLLVVSNDAGKPVKLLFADCYGLGVQRENNEWWLLPISTSGKQVDANRALWVLPLDATSKKPSWHIQLEGGDLSAEATESGLTVIVHAKKVILSKADTRPHSDPFGHRFSFAMDGGQQLEEALAGFYWGTMLPSVVEKTMAANFPYHDGYVLSTLNVSSYAGSYPAVDHEFQIKGDCNAGLGEFAHVDSIRCIWIVRYILLL